MFHLPSGRELVIVVGMAMAMALGGVALIVLLARKGK